MEPEEVRLRVAHGNAIVDEVRTRQALEVYLAQRRVDAAVANAGPRPGFCGRLAVELARLDLEKARRR